MTLNRFVGVEPILTKDVKDLPYTKRIYSIAPTTATTINWQAPGGKIWDVKQIQVTYATNATVGNRFPFSYLRNNNRPTGDTIWAWYPVLGASSNRYYNWMPNVSYTNMSTGFYEVVYMPFPDLLIDDDSLIVFGADTSGAPGSTNTWSGKLVVLEYDA